MFAQVGFTVDFLKPSCGQRYPIMQGCSCFFFHWKKSTFASDSNQIIILWLSSSFFFFFFICNFFFPALPDMFQRDHRRPVPPLWGDVRRLWSVGHQSAHRDHLLLRGDHHPAANYTGLQVHKQPTWVFFYYYSKAKEHKCQHEVPHPLYSSFGPCGLSRC